MRGVSKGMFAVRLIPVWILAAGLCAQIQFPGGGNGGPFPGGGGGPFPGGNGGPNGGGGRGRTNNPPDRTPGRGRKDAVPVITTTGILRLVAGNQFVLEADDHRIITYRSGDKMTVQQDGKPAELKAFAVADHLSVDATSDDMGYFTAVSVTFNMPGTAQERETASRNWDLPSLRSVPKSPAGKRNSDDDDRPTLRRKSEDAPTPVADVQPAAPPATTVRPNDPTPDADDPGRPALRRGKPAASSSTPVAVEAPLARPDTQAATPAEPEPVIAIQEDPIIVKAKEAAAAYSGTLPNFLCRQTTTRYDSDNPKTGWQAHDVITADVTYQDGTQSYKNIKVGSKSFKSMEETGGNWSTGEFASWLDDLFDPSSAARFRRSGQESLRGRSSYVFKFDVTREHSHWRVSDGAQLYYPAYRGTIWVDRDSSRVLRLEVEARGVPLLFPLDKVEMATDYDQVRLTASQGVLLPTDAEVLSCEHGSTHCSRNRIEFRNYHKFGAESGITFDEKQ